MSSPVLDLESLERAKQILGADFIGVEDVTEHLRLSYTDVQRKKLREIPFTEKTLLECAGTHVLFPGYPVSLFTMRPMLSGRGILYDAESEEQRSSGKQAWYDSESWAHDKLELSWFLVQKAPAARSIGRTYEEQERYLLANEQVPRVIEVTFLVVLYYLVAGRRLLSDTWARCREAMDGACHATVGEFDCFGLGINCAWDSERIGTLGLASSRRH